MDCIINLTMIQVDLDFFCSLVRLDLGIYVALFSMAYKLHARILCKWILNWFKIDRKKNRPQKSIRTTTK